MINWCGWNKNSWSPKNIVLWVYGGYTMGYFSEPYLGISNGDYVPWNGDVGCVCYTSWESWWFMSEDRNHHINNRSTIRFIWSTMIGRLIIVMVHNDSLDGYPYFNHLMIGYPAVIRIGIWRLRNVSRFSRSPDAQTHLSHEQKNWLVNIGKKNYQQMYGSMIALL